MVTVAEVITDDGENLFLKVRKPFPVKGEVLVELDDGEQISSSQRRKIYALLNCISASLGYTPVETTKETMKYYYAGITEHLRRDFSLSDCSMKMASDFITFLIDFCLEQDIPCGEPLQTLCDDLEKYIFACLYNKKCACCGKKGELHHVDAVGMGNDRRRMYQIGMRVLPLCRKHHTEMHTMTDGDFLRRYHIIPVPLTEKVAEVYRLSKKAKGVK